MKQRIIGFDLARAYAILGMFIVNFNIVFGTPEKSGFAGQFLSSFNGNSSTLFVILAGMGISLMTNRAEYAAVDKKTIRATIRRRANFLLIIGLILNVWWPADILHFYGIYMHIAVFVLFSDKKYYLFAAIGAVIIFHLLLTIVPFETGWNFETLHYNDFYTPAGFLRNTFYNGWNAVFPWISYFFLGMFLGRLNFNEAQTWYRLFLTGLLLYTSIGIVQVLSRHIPMRDDLQYFINADYLPPFLPFILSTTGFGFMLIAGFMFLGNKVSENSFARDLASTGQMTLTHYILHLTIGMALLGVFSNKSYSVNTYENEFVSPVWILIFSIFYFLISFYFSKLWSRYFRNGPFETLMRKIADS